jgi:hypothetical protein
MHSVRIVSLLAERTLEARARAWGARAEGKDPRSIEAVGGSCRRTLAWVLQPRDPGEIPVTRFRLVVSPAGEVAVLHRELPLEVSGPYLRSLFAEAGVELVSGETLLLEGILVKLLVEEALGAVSREETLLRDAKARLMSASREAESVEPAGISCPAEGRWLEFLENPENGF